MESKLLVTSASAVAVFGWEHVARLFELNIKPSMFIMQAVSLFNYVFENFGKTLGAMSSYLWWLKLDEIKKTCRDLFVPVYDLVVSPRFVVTGWYNYVKTFLGNNFHSDSWQFYLGLFGLIACVTALIGTHLYKKGKKYCPIKKIGNYITNRN